MNALVDTCVWSLAFRRRRPTSDPAVQELHELVKEGRARIMGPIRQELLSGIREELQFRKLRDAMRAFPDLDVSSADFERAAEYYTRCRRHGVQGSNTDFLICAVAERFQLPILTTDTDFAAFAKHIPLQLYARR